MVHRLRLGTDIAYFIFNISFHATTRLWRVQRQIADFHTLVAHSFGQHLEIAALQDLKSARPGFVFRIAAAFQTQS